MQPNDGYTVLVNDESTLLGNDEFTWIHICNRIMQLWSFERFHKMELTGIMWTLYPVEVDPKMVWQTIFIRWNVSVRGVIEAWIAITTSGVLESVTDVALSMS